MVDLSAEMADLWASLGAPTAGRARVIQVIAARRGEGTSTVARELALHAARRGGGKGVWLVDLDLLGGTQHEVIAANSARYGSLGEAASASPDGSSFFTVQPPIRGAQGQVPDARYLAAHRVGKARWWVTRFRRDALRGRQTVHMLPSGDYWQALRRFADLVIVDSPSPERSQAGLAVAPHMDQTLMVVAADERDVQAPARLRDAIGAAGGHVAGLFFNRAVVERPAFLKAILP